MELKLLACQVIFTDWVNFNRTSWNWNDISRPLALLTGVILIEPVGIEMTVILILSWKRCHFNRTSWNWNKALATPDRLPWGILIEPVGIEILEARNERHYNHYFNRTSWNWNNRRIWYIKSISNNFNRTSWNWNVGIEILLICSWLILIEPVGIEMQETKHRQW